MPLGPRYVYDWVHVTIVQREGHPRVPLYRSPWVTSQILASFPESGTASVVRAAPIPGGWYRVADGTGFLRLDAAVSFVDSEDDEEGTGADSDAAVVSVVAIPRGEEAAGGASVDASSKWPHFTASQSSCRFSDVLHPCCPTEHIDDAVATSTHTDAVIGVGGSSTVVLGVPRQPGMTVASVATVAGAAREPVAVKHINTASLDTARALITESRIGFFAARLQSHQIHPRPRGFLCPCLGLFNAELTAADAARDAVLSTPLTPKLLKPRSCVSNTGPASVTKTATQTPNTARRSNAVELGQSSFRGGRLAGWPPRLALVMRLASHGTLADLIAAVGPLRPVEAAAILAGVLEALHQLHVGCGHAHLDLKPANVFFTSAGEVMLGDFGSAREFVDDSTRIGLDSEPLGTPGFVAPEVIGAMRTGSTDTVMIDGVLADVYGVGRLLQEMLSGGDLAARGVVWRKKPRTAISDCSSGSCYVVPVHLAESIPLYVVEFLNTLTQAHPTLRPTKLSSIATSPFLASPDVLCPWMSGRWWTFIANLTRGSMAQRFGLMAARLSTESTMPSTPCNAKRAAGVPELPRPTSASSATPHPAPLSVARPTTTSATRPTRGTVLRFESARSGSVTSVRQTSSVNTRSLSEQRVGSPAGPSPIKPRIATGSVFERLASAVRAPPSDRSVDPVRNTACPLTGRVAVTITSDARASAPRATPKRVRNVRHNVPVPVLATRRRAPLVVVPTAIVG
jgi:serine/threonine protein kinase